MTKKTKELKTNVIICGDCERRMKEHIPDESIDLIYLDPPFFSGKDYDLIWGKGDGKSKATIKVFEDAALYVKKCGECGRIWRKNPRGEFYKTCGTVNCKGRVEDAKDVRMSDIYVFVEWMRPRIKGCYRVLKPTGSIYLHVDWHSVHYMKVMMDEIFGYDNFLNEIIWSYKSGGASKQFFGRKHDTILFYSKNNNKLFNPQYDKRDESELVKYPHIDDNGRYQWWAKPGSKAGGKEGKKIYFEPGTIMRDVWEIPIINQMSKERLGYPTQKPEILLERIIKASSNEGDVILDPFCGCGTAIAAAQKLNRKWIGLDVEPLSCTVMQHRLATMGDHNIEAEIVDLKKTLTEKEVADIIEQSGKMKGQDFQKWVIEVINGTQNPKCVADRGVDGWIDEPLTGKSLKYHTLENGDPIQVKMMDRIGGPVIRLFATDMQDYSDHGVIIAYGFANTANMEVEKAYKKHGVKIELVTIRDILMLTDKDHVKKAKKIPKEQTHLGKWES